MLETSLSTGFLSVVISGFVPILCPISRCVQIIFGVVLHGHLQLPFHPSLIIKKCGIILLNFRWKSSRLEIYCFLLLYPFSNVPSNPITPSQSRFIPLSNRNPPLSPQPNLLCCKFSRSSGARGPGRAEAQAGLARQRRIWRAGSHVSTT